MFQVVNCIHDRGLPLLSVACEGLTPETTKGVWFMLIEWETCSIGQIRERCSNYKPWASTPSPYLPPLLSLPPLFYALCYTNWTRPGPRCFFGVLIRPEIKGTPFWLHFKNWSASIEQHFDGISCRNMSPVAQKMPQVISNYQGHFLSNWTSITFEFTTTSTKPYLLMIMPRATSPQVRWTKEFWAKNLLCDYDGNCCQVAAKLLRLWGSKGAASFSGVHLSLDCISCPLRSKKPEACRLVGREE